MVAESQTLTNSFEFNGILLCVDCFIFISGFSLQAENFCWSALLRYPPHFLPNIRYGLNNAFEVEFFLENLKVSKPCLQRSNIGKRGYLTQIVGKVMSSSISVHLSPSYKCRNVLFRLFRLPSGFFFLLVIPDNFFIFPAFVGFVFTIHSGSAAALFLRDERTKLENSWNHRCRRSNGKYNFFSGHFQTAGECPSRLAKEIKIGMKGQEQSESQSRQGRRTLSLTLHIEKFSVEAFQMVIVSVRAFLLHAGNQMMAKLLIVKSWDDPTREREYFKINLEYFSG